MLTPSMGLWAMPLTIAGAWRCAASRIVGTMSMTWWNCVRMPPTSLMRSGHDDGHALPGAAEVRRHLLGPLERCVEAQDQATDMCGMVLSEPQAS